MKVLKILLIIFMSFSFTNIGQEIEINCLSDECVVLEVETKEDLSFVEILLKVYNEIRYSLYRGFREFQVYRSKITLPKTEIIIVK